MRGLVRDDGIGFQEGTRKSGLINLTKGEENWHLRYL